MIEKAINVLMLEDQPTDSMLIKRSVKKAAPNALFNVARNKKEFEEKLEWVVPDVVLCDYHLPDMNGLEALIHIRETKSHLPFIFVSGTLNDEEKVAEAILKGASGYVLKENLELLPDVLKRVLEQAEKEQEVEAENERKQRECIMDLQKSLSILEQAPDFERKDEMKKLLSEIIDKL